MSVCVWCVSGVCVCVVCVWGDVYMFYMCRRWKEGREGERGDKVDKITMCQECCVSVSAWEQAQGRKVMHVSHTHSSYVTYM